MASLDDSNAVAALLASKTTTPIAQLQPGLPAQSTLSVRGEVGIIWPYNAVTKTIAFLVAEPDVRLRRAKGQVRIELHGPSAKALSKCDFGAGDEILLSLDGVDWASDTSPGRIPGSRIDWQLQFREKLVLQIKSGESEELKYISVDGRDDEPEPAPEPPVEPVIESRFTTPEADESPEDIPNLRKFFQLATNEFSSPAFLKRARISYGALYEGVDIFEEDGGVKHKGRKRARFGGNGGAWRYTSQSPSPEPSPRVQDAMDEDMPDEESTEASPRNQTVDEGSQTVDTDMMQDAPAPLNNHVLNEVYSPQKDVASVTGEPEGRQGSPTRKDLASPPHVVQEIHEDNPKSPEQHPGQQQTTREQATPERHPIRLLQVPNNQNFHPDASSSTATEAAPSSMFETSKPALQTYSMFGTSAPSRPEPATSIADQVKFGFSHVPETDYPSAAPEHHQHTLYPVSYLDHPHPTDANYPDMTHYAQDPQQTAGHDHGLVPRPPMVETFHHGHWEVPTQASFYNPIEGGHFGADALGDGSRIAAEHPSSHATDISPDRVPPGFATYGGNVAHEAQPQDFQGQTLDASGSEPVDSPQTGRADPVEIVDLDEDEDEEEDEDDAEADAEYDRYGLPEPTEEGDYDQRNYNNPSDDEEGLSEEDEEIEQETSERYGDGEVYDEDGEPWDEDEGEEGLEGEEDYEDEEYGESEEDGHDDESRRSYSQPSYGRVQSSYQSQGHPTSAPKGPVEVISLLSDSEDDDEPAPAPTPTPASVPAATAPPPQKAPITVEVEATSKEAETSSLAASETNDTTPGSPNVEAQSSQDAAEPADTTYEQTNDTKPPLGNTDVVDFASSEDKDFTEQAREPEDDFDGGQESSLSNASEEESEGSEYIPEDQDKAASQSESVDAEGEDVKEDPTDVVKFVEEKPSPDLEEESEGTKEADVQEANPAADTPAKLSETETQAPAEFSATEAQVSVDDLKDENTASVAEIGGPAQSPDSNAVPGMEDSSGYATDDQNSSFASQVEITEDMEIEEEEQQQEAEVTTQPPATTLHQHGDVATDDKTMSFVTEVEIDEVVEVEQIEEVEEVEVMVEVDDVNELDKVDEEMDDASVDEVMMDHDAPVEHQEGQHVAHQTLISEDVEIVDVIDEDDDDVAMLDAATPVPSADLEEEDDDDVDMLQARESESRGEPEEAASSVATTEYMSKVIVTEEVTTVHFSVPDSSETLGEFATQVGDALRQPGEPTQEPEKTVQQSPKEPDNQTVPSVANPFSPPLTNSSASQRVEHEVPTKAHQLFTLMQSQPLGDTTAQVQEESEEESFSDAVEQQDNSLDKPQETRKETADVDGKTGQQVIGGTQEKGGVEVVSHDESESDEEEVIPQSSILSPPPQDLEEDEALSVGESEEEGSFTSFPEGDGAAESNQAAEGEESQDEQADEQETSAREVKQPAVEDIEDKTTVSTPSTQAQQSPEPEPEADHSVNLARQAAKTTRRSKRAAAAAAAAVEPTRISPRLIRGRSASLHTITTDEGDSSVNLAKGALSTPSRDKDKDSSVDLAKGALESPSKRTPVTATAETSSSSPTAVKNDLVRRLRTELSECVALKNIRYHNEKQPNIVAIAVSKPPAPARARGGPREYSMTFYVTDPSIAPKEVVEVQLYRPHKDHLPVLKVGDAILLQRPQVRAFKGKGHGLRSTAETGWAVFDEDEGPPQIKGLPVEDWEVHREYMTGLREWWRAIGEGERKKVEEKVKKMKEV